MDLLESLSVEVGIRNTALSQERVSRIAAEILTWQQCAA